MKNFHSNFQVFKNHILYVIFHLCLLTQKQQKHDVNLLFLSVCRVVNFFMSLNYIF